MTKVYQKAVCESLPNATIAIVHFHIAKLANEALNEVWRELGREVHKSGLKAAKAIKGMQ